MKVLCSYSILATFDDVPENITAKEVEDMVHEWADEQGFENLVNDFEWEVVPED